MDLFALPLNQRDYGALIVHLVMHSYYLNVDEILNQRLDVLTEDGGYTAIVRLQENPPVLILYQGMRMTEHYAEYVQQEEEGLHGLPHGRAHFPWYQSTCKESELPALARRLVLKAQKTAEREKYYL